MEEVFELVSVKQVEATENKKQLSGKQIQALLDSAQPKRKSDEHYNNLLKL